MTILTVWLALSPLALLLLWALCVMARQADDAAPSVGAVGDD